MLNIIFIFSRLDENCSIYSTIFTNSSFFLNILEKTSFVLIILVFKLFSFNLWLEMNWTILAIKLLDESHDFLIQRHSRIIYKNWLILIIKFMSEKHPSDANKEIGKQYSNIHQRNQK